MEENRQEFEVDTVKAEPDKKFLASIADIFVDPGKVFNRIDAGLEWWKPFILVAAVMIIMVWAQAPVNMQVMSLNERGLSEEQLQMALDRMGTFQVVGYIVAPIAAITIYLLSALVINITANLMSGRSDYRKALSLSIFVGLIPLVEQIISVVVVRMRGIEAIQSTQDAQISLSLAPLFSDAGNFVNSILKSLSIFSIWYYIVMALGIAAIYRINVKKSAVPVVILWIISFLFIYLGSLFSVSA
ncbi:MAG: YIP1 family protein [Candidatus Krumholzibacteriales bacterium]